MLQSSGQLGYADVMTGSIETIEKVGLKFCVPDVNTWIQEGSHSSHYRQFYQMSVSSEHSYPFSPRHTQTNVSQVVLNLSNHFTPTTAIIKSYPKLARDSLISYCFGHMQGPSSISNKGLCFAYGLGLLIGLWETL